MSREREEHLNMPNALLGLILEPGFSSNVLVRNQAGQFSIAFICLFFISIFLPILIQQYQYRYTVYDPQAVISLFVVMIFCILLFSMLQHLMLSLMGIPSSPRLTFACISYALAPFLLAIWIMYLFNYLTSGSLTMVRVLVTGFGSSNDLFLRALPVAFVIASLNVVLVFFYSIKALADCSTTSALFLLVVSFFPFLLSLTVSLIIGEVVRPGTVDLFSQILADPKALTNYR